MDEQNDVTGDELNNEGDGFASISNSWAGTAEEAVTRMTHCAVCGGNLHFTHITDFSRNVTQETARCPECGVQIRRQYHKLQ